MSEVSGPSDPTTSAERPIDSSETATSTSGGNTLGQRAHQAASILYFVFAAGVMLTGLVYASSPQFMPYHEEVAGMGWVEIPERLRVLHLAFQHGAGAMAVAFGGVLIAINACSFRRGDRWAVIALPVSGFAVGIPVLDIALQLSSATGAHTPIFPLMLGALILGAAALLQWASRHIWGT